MFFCNEAEFGFLLSLTIFPQLNSSFVYNILNISAFGLTFFSTSENRFCSMDFFLTNGNLFYS